jgi:hypothetical protein
MAKRLGKKISPNKDPMVKLILDRDGGEVYLQEDGSKIVYYPNGTECQYSKGVGLR